MRQLIRTFSLIIMLLVWWLAIDAPFSNIVDFSVHIGSMLLIVPIVLLGRKSLYNDPTPKHITLVLDIVHYSIVFLMGLALIRAIVSHKEWAVWTIPVPQWIGLTLVLLTAPLCLATVLNLALKGLGAPFAIALTSRLAVDWLYAWTRNPMVLATIVFLVCLGVWFQSVMFVVWVLGLFTPVLLFYVKVFEERELELRFGASYLEYKAKTPMLFPTKPKK